jgi:hypothetical protein
MAETIALAFSNESLSLRDWLPIIKRVWPVRPWVIPPALDQVLVGAVDPVHNPDLRVVIVQNE